MATVAIGGETVAEQRIVAPQGGLMHVIALMLILSTPLIAHLDEIY